MRDLREKTEALQIPLRPLPREASKGEAQINWEQTLLRKQGYRTLCKGQESRTPPPHAWWPIAAPNIEVVSGPGCAWQLNCIHA
jgi:hypothetical protein